MNLSIARAADILLGGGVIAYPTEGVFGLGCAPDDAEAVMHILKNRRSSGLSRPTFHWLSWMRLCSNRDWR